MPGRLYEVSKRGIDVVVAGGVLAATAPVSALAAGAILVTMGRPVLFRQRRPGLHGAPFDLLKFRTMRAPRHGEDPLATDASRLTRVGRALRAASIDEIPSMINVLRGDMSLVGPRPLLTRYLERYTPRQARRHEVRPGVTGWAQIHGRNACPWPERLERDVWYVEHRSLLLDLTILARTALPVLTARGVEDPGGAGAEFMGDPLS